MEYKKWKRTTNRKKGFFLLALMAVVALTACGSSKERKMAPDSGIHHFREVEEVNLPEEEIAKADFVKMPGGVSVLYGRRRGSGETEDRTIYGFNAGW